jgi:hypothetical protein
LEQFQNQIHDRSLSWLDIGTLRKLVSSNISWLLRINYTIYLILFLLVSFKTLSMSFHGYLNSSPVGFVYLHLYIFVLCSVDHCFSFRIFPFFNFVGVFKFSFMVEKTRPGVISNWITAMLKMCHST